MTYHKFFFIILIFLFQSCTFFNFEPVRQGSVQEKKIEELEKKEIVIECDFSCTKDEKNKLPEIVKEVNRVFYGECFKNYFENKKKFDFAGTETGKKIIETLRKSEIKTTLTYFFKRRNPFTGSLVIGYENGDGKIHANRAAWNFLTVEEKVSNMIHEITHQKGYKHDGNSYAGNENSVPYQANSAVETCF